MGPGVSEELGLQRFFWMWTIKEAYTKALGLGLGFEFWRVEFDPERYIVRVNGEIPKGWKIYLFTLQDGEDLYEGAVADYVGEDEELTIERPDSPHPWLKLHTTKDFMERSVDKLGGVKVS